MYVDTSACFSPGFYGHHHELVDRYDVSVTPPTNDMSRGQFFFRYKTIEIRSEI